MTRWVFRATSLSATIEHWTVILGAGNLTTIQPATPAPTDAAAATPDEITLDDAIRDYVRTYALWHGRPQAARHFGVSRHTLWRCLERGRLGRALPKAVSRTVGDDPHAIAAADGAMSPVRRIQRRAAAGPKPLPEPLEDALPLLCAAPLATGRNYRLSAGFQPPPCAVVW